MVKSFKLKVYYSEEDECYIAECDKYIQVMGAAETEDEAIKIFYEHLERFLNAQEKGNVVKIGRPKTTNLRLDVNIPLKTRAYIDIIAAKKGKKQGEVVEELVNFYNKHKYCENIDKSGQIN